MKLEQLKRYFVGQRFTIRCHANLLPECFELHIMSIEDETLHCYFRYLEGSDVVMKLKGDIDYERHVLDGMLDDCWERVGDWQILGFLPIKPLNKLPEEIFAV